MATFNDSTVGTGTGGTTPDFSAAQTSRPRTRVSQLGDGYRQAVSFGLHTDLKSWSLKFAKRTDSDVAAINSFLEDKKGVTSFDWTPPTTGANQSKFICEECNITMDAYNLNTLSATFKEVAEP